MSSRVNVNSRWSLTRGRSEVTDVLRREWEARAVSDPGATYDPRPVSELHRALDAALALDDASKVAVRPILNNREIGALLAARLGTRESGE